MKYTIISDSVCDLRSKDLTCPQIDFFVAPITLSLDGVDIVDDETVIVTEMIEKMKDAKVHGKTACPSPEVFKQQMRTGDNIIVVTVSSKLSGTYASAMIAAEEIKKEYPNKKVFVLDSLSASAGQARILFRLKELIESGKYTFEEITTQITDIRSKTRTRFLLQDLTNLIKSGRIGKFVGTLLNTARIKLICGDNAAGEIKKISMVLSVKKGFCNLAEMAGKDSNPDSQVTISHVNNEKDATFIKSLLETKFGLKNIKILLTRGVATLYGADKGIIIGY